VGSVEVHVMIVVIPGIFDLSLLNAESNALFVAANKR